MTGAQALVLLGTALGFFAVWWAVLTLRQRIERRIDEYSQAAACGVTPSQAMRIGLMAAQCGLSDPDELEAALSAWVRRPDDPPAWRYTPDDPNRGEPDE